MSNQGEKKGVSAIDFFCIGFGAIVGVGWAVSINNWMSGSGGPIPAGLGYIAALIMMVPIALCYCELVPALPVAGGGMAFAFRAFNDKVAVISGWAAFGGFVSIIPWEAIQITDVLGYLIPGLTDGEPLYYVAGTGIHLTTIIIGVICSFLLFALNMRGLAAAAGVQKILCFILVGSAVVGAVASLLHGSPEHWQPLYDTSNPMIYGDPSQGYVEATNSSMFGGILAIMSSAPFFLAGFETIPQGVEEAGGDIKSVGKTVVLSVTLALIGPFLGAGLIGDITSFSGAAFVLSWGLTSYSLASLRKKEPNLERPYKVPGGAAMGWFAGIVSTVVFILLFIPASPMYMKSTACIMFVGWMIIGLILYLAASGQRRGKSQTELKEGVFHGMEERKQA